MTKKLLGSLELNRIYQRDCLEGMEMIPDKSLDLIVIDPPYNIGKDKRWDMWKTVEEYVNWMSCVFKECERVLKPNGSFYWFHNDMDQIRKLMDALDGTSFVYKQLITWNKIDPSFKNYGYVQQRLSIDMMRNYYNGFTEYCAYYTFKDREGLKEIYDDENCFKTIRDYLKEEKRRSGMTNKQFSLIFSEYTGKTEGCKDRSVIEHYFSNKQWTLPTKELYENVLQKTGYFSRSYHDLLTEYSILRDEYETLRIQYEKERYPFNVATVKDDLRANSNVWLYPPAKNLGHVTPKPVEMIENIILHSSNEGDTVLDCFMGSGTTAVAATRLNRNFIGFERETEYVKIANQRLEAVQDEIAERKLIE
jgi:DNA modification methylase